MKSFYPEKQVTLIHSGSELIDKTGLNTGAYFKTLLQNQLEALDVEVIVGTKVSKVWNCEKYNATLFEGRGQL